MPKEEFPPSPECWRQHPSKPNSVPYCYFNKPEIYTHWHDLYDQREERETEKMLRKMTDDHRCVLLASIFSSLSTSSRKVRKGKEGVAQGVRQVSLQVPERSLGWLGSAQLHLAWPARLGSGGYHRVLIYLPLFPFLRWAGALWQRWGCNLRREGTRGPKLPMQFLTQVHQRSTSNPHPNVPSPHEQADYKIWDAI